MTPPRASRLPERLSETVLGELDRLGGARPGQPAGMAAVLEVWPAAVGETIAQNAWPARFGRDGTLVVHTSSSTWAFELTQLAETVRARLGDAAPPRLSFVVGPVPEPGAESVPEARRLSREASPAHAAEGARIAREIEDPALREAVARAVAAALRRAAPPAGSTGASDTL